MADDFEDWLDDDEDGWLAEWDEADRQAAEVLREACPDLIDSPAPRAAVEAAAATLREGVTRGRWPFEYFVNACGWQQELPERDVDLWVSALAATMSPPSDPGIDVEQTSAVLALFHADWLGMVVGLVRRGVGAEFSAEAAQRDIDTLPELEGEIDDPEGQFGVLSMAVATVAPLWQALGVLDEGERLTELGRWGLPNALLVTWSGPAATEAERARLERLDEDDASKALAILARHPITLEELRLEVAKEGVFTSVDQLRSSLVWRTEVYEFDDGVWVHLPTLAEGVVLTHRVTQDELALGVLSTELDLDLAGLLALDGHPLAGGGEVKTRFRADKEPTPDEAGSGLVGPDGWLSGFAFGDLLAVRYVDGELAVDRLQLSRGAGEHADVQVLIDTAREAAELDAVHGDPEVPGVSGTEIVLRCRREHPQLFSTPLPPLSEILGGSEQLEIERGYVGLPGTAWHGVPSWLNDDQRSTYQSWLRVLAAHRRDGSLPEVAELGSLAASLADGLLSLAAVDMTSDPEREPVTAAMADTVSDPLAAVAAYLRACAAEGRGEGSAWLAHLERAVAADGTCSEALGDLADLRSVAGDAREAHRLFALAGLETTAPEMQILRRYLEPPEGVGRNKPCPCGSGKKYKVCHGRTDAHPLSSRAPWLWDKIETSCQRGPNRAVVLDWAERVTGASRVSRETVFRAMGDPIVVDFAVFGGGLLQRFLQVLGPLLPADERELAERWIGTPLRLMEVLEVRPMRGARVRDLGSGEEITIADRRMAAELGTEDLLLGRPLEDGDGGLRLQVTPLEVPRSLQGDLLAAMSAGEEAVAGLIGEVGRTSRSS